MTTIVDYLLGDDPTLQADTLLLYDRLCDQLGQLELGRVITMDYPMLIKSSTPLLVVWWLLSNIADTLHATPPAPQTAPADGRAGWAR